jgi:TPR repeat protein
MDHIINHMRLAAEGGEAIAQFNLGIVYNNGLDDNGHDADRNRREAIKWLRKAAQQGLARAQSKLAEIYAEVSDVEPAYPPV